MNDNLQAQYFEVMNYLEEFRKFNIKLINRLPFFMFRHPIRYYRLIFKSSILPVSYISRKNFKTTQLLLDDIATSEEKSTEYFNCLYSEYPYETISNNLRLKFKGYNFKKIRQVHKLYENQFSRFNAIPVLGVVLGLGTILLNDVPVSVIKNFVEVESYEYAVFLVTAVCYLYLLLIFSPYWLHNTKSKITHRFAEDVLEYIVIKEEDN